MSLKEIKNAPPKAVVAGSAGSGSIGRVAGLLTFVSVYLIVRFPLAALILLALVLAQGQEFQVPAKLYEMVAMGVETVVLASVHSAASSEAWRLGATSIDPQDTEGLVKLMERARCGSVARRRCS